MSVSGKITLRSASYVAANSGIPAAYAGGIISPQANYDATFENLTVTNDLTVGGLSSLHDTTISGDLLVQPKTVGSTVTGGDITSETLHTNSNAVINGGLNVSGTLKVSGQVNDATTPFVVTATTKVLGSGFEVGATNSASSAKVYGTLNVTGASTLASVTSSSLTVTGSTNLKGVVATTGDFTKVTATDEVQAQAVRAALVYQRGMSLLPGVVLFNGGFNTLNGFIMVCKSKANMDFAGTSNDTTYPAANKYTDRVATVVSWNMTNIFDYVLLYPGYGIEAFSQTNYGGIRLMNVMNGDGQPRVFALSTFNAMNSFKIYYDHVELT